MPSPEPGSGHAATGISRCSGWRAAAANRRARAGARAARRRAHACGLRRTGSAAPRRGVPARTAGSGLGGRPQRADRHPLERGRCRAPAQRCGGIGRARPGRHPGRCRRDHSGAATGEPHRADRVRPRPRPGRRRLCREPGAARRQRHRLYPVRIQLEREMA